MESKSILEVYSDLSMEQTFNNGVSFHFSGLALPYKSTLYIKDIGGKMLARTEFELAHNSSINTPMITLYQPNDKEIVVPNYSSIGGKITLPAEELVSLLRDGEISLK